MKESENLLSVNILDRSYSVKCPPEQTYELQQSANYLNDQMKRLRHASNITNTESLAVVAALNIANEWMQLKNQKNQYIDSMHERIQALTKKIEDFLATKEDVAV
jgi:cell division protein ZapA